MNGIGPQRTVAGWKPAATSGSYHSIEVNMVVSFNPKIVTCTGVIHALELLFLFPIILALILGMVEFSLLLSVDQQLAVASREGARVAAQGGSASEVETAARLVLGSWARTGKQQ